jgi:hypothetical protein
VALTWHWPYKDLHEDQARLVLLTVDLTVDLESTEDNFREKRSSEQKMVRIEFQFAFRKGASFDEYVKACMSRRA